MTWIIWTTGNRQIVFPCSKKVTIDVLSFLDPSQDNPAAKHFASHFQQFCNILCIFPGQKMKLGQVRCNDIGLLAQFLHCRNNGWIKSGIERTSIPHHWINNYWFELICPYPCTKLVNSSYCAKVTNKYPIKGNLTFLPMPKRLF